MPLEYRFYEEDEEKACECCGAEGHEVRLAMIKPDRHSTRYRDQGFKDPYPICELCACTLAGNTVDWPRNGSNENYAMYRHVCAVANIVQRNIISIIQKEGGR